MAGSWEIKRNNSVLCGILHVDTTTIAWSFGLRNLIVPGQIIGLAGMPYDHARNTACQHCLAGGFDWMFFLDSDVIPPRDTVLRLIAHNKPIISGMYCRRSPPHGVPVMIRHGQWVTNFRPGEIVEVDLVGAGCLLIHRTVLESLPHSRPGKPWFDWRVDLMGIDPEGCALSEDFVFCKNVREKLGIPILVDTSIRCRHVGYAEADLGNFKPCEATPVT